MKIPIRRDKKIFWIVVEPSLIAGDKEVAEFIKEVLGGVSLYQEGAVERVIKEAQKRGIIAYLKEER